VQRERERKINKRKTIAPTTNPLLAKFPLVYSIFVPPEDGRRPKHMQLKIKLMS
jgi:hypothetical protein